MGCMPKLQLRYTCARASDGQCDGQRNMRMSINDDKRRALQLDVTVHQDCYASSAGLDRGGPVHGNVQSHSILACNNFADRVVQFVTLTDVPRGHVVDCTSY